MGHKGLCFGSRRDAGASAGCIPQIQQEAEKMAERKFKQVCHCEKCGNEAEMMITCQLVPEDGDSELENREIRVSQEEKEGGMPAQAVCTKCGNEADIWLDMSES
jgi:DNA-directed RNA polymerase subunit M/transcription elongation factor TFIIS